MPTIRYAAYGSNLHPARLSARVASARWIGRARVEGYALHFHKRGQDGSAKCNLLAGNAASCIAVFELEGADKPVLDAIEGVGNGYEEATIQVPGFGNCHTYSAAPTHIDETLAPFDWYKALVLLGCAWNGFPEDYLERVRALPHVPDPDDERRARHRRLIAQIQDATRVGSL